MGLSYVIENYLKIMPEATAFVMSGQNLSWRELFSKIELYKKALVSLNAKRIAVYFSQNIESISLLIASSEFPIETILISTYYNQESAVTFMRDFSAEYLISAENEKINILSSQQVPEDIIVDEPYVCLLTSGTTGIPKCVKRRWISLTEPIKVDSNYLQKQWLQCYPITHFAGMQNFLRCYLNGGCLLIPPDFAPHTALKMIANYKIDYLNCTPTYMRQLLLIKKDENLPSLKHITLAGEAASQSLLDDIKNNFPSAKVTHIYGSSELGMLIMVRDGKEGFPAELIDNVKFKVIDSELYVKPSSQAMKGYLNSPDLNETEWIATKDLVEIKDDRCLFLGRRDDIINVGGYKVNPHVVEAVIREIPDVIDVAIMPHKSPLVGNLIKAKVCVSADADAKNIEAKIISQCKKQLPDYMTPRLFEFSSELAVTETQKLLRREV